MPRKKQQEEVLGSGYVNHTQQAIRPATARFMYPEQIAAELGISKWQAQKKILTINKDLEKDGHMFFTGRVLRKIWIEKTGG